MKQTFVFLWMVVSLAVISPGCGKNAAAQNSGVKTGDSANSSSSTAIPIDQENSRKAKALIDQMIAALGGQTYLSIQDISQEGRVYGFHLGRPTGAGAIYWRFYKFPDEDRIELTKKRDVIEIFRSDKGFEVTYKGTRSQDPKELSDYLRRRETSLDWVIRKWLNEPGVALFYEGPAVAAQKNAEQVTVMNTRNQGVTLYIDAETHLPIKKSFSWRDPSDKQRNVEEEVYDNYRPVQGVMTPYSVTRYYNGDMANQRFLNSVSYNKGLSDSLFAADVTYDPNQGSPKK
jgi:hypothetical protein